MGGNWPNTVETPLLTVCNGLLAAYRWDCQSSKGWTCKGMWWKHLGEPRAVMVGG